MKRRVVAILLAAGMIMSSLSGCGQSTPTNDSSKESVESTSADTAKSTAAANSTEDSAKEEPVTITVAAWDRGNVPAELGTFTDNKWANLIKESILEEKNINIEWVAIPRWENVTKLQALMAAGEEPDIFYEYGLDTILQWYDAEALADLTPYMETEVGIELKEALGEDHLKYGQIEGKQYALNAVRCADFGTSVGYLRKDMLDEVGVDLETVDGHYVITPSELQEALLAIKEGGICDYPYGMAGGPNGQGAVMGAFRTDITERDLAKGGADWMVDPEGSKEAYRWLNSCYNDGLINPDFALFDTSNLQEMIATSQVAFWEGSFYAADQLNGATALYEENPDAEIVVVEVVHEDGSPAVYNKNGTNGAYAVVSSSCENVEAALEVMEWCLLSEASHLITHHGIEGVNFEVNADGYYEVIDAEFNAKDRLYNHADYIPLINYDPCWATPESYKWYRSRTNFATYSDKVQANIYTGMAISEHEENYVIPALNGVNQAKIDYAAELSENSTNMKVGSITAPASEFDQIYDNYYNVYMEEGGEEMAEINLEIYDKNYQ